MRTELKLLNLGCGSHYHQAWTNIDFISNGEQVQAHNLLKGIPFPDDSFNVVYHSHVLEHFTKKDGEDFIRECFRVLKKEGIIRIAVPDLEQIVRGYISNLDKATSGDLEGQQNYDWIKLELYDQTIRNKSGGAMKDYLFQTELANEKYVFDRLGMEAKNMRQHFLENRNGTPSTDKQEKINFKKYFKLSNYKQKLKNILLTNKEKEALKIGEFRMGGEIHQWMYDSYSLKTLLEGVGFNKIRVCRADDSSIPNWNDYQLDVINGEVRKPDSLFMEASK